MLSGCVWSVQPTTHMVHTDVPPHHRLFLWQRAGPSPIPWVPVGRGTAAWNVLRTEVGPPLDSACCYRTVIPTRWGPQGSHQPSNQGHSHDLGTSANFIPQKIKI